MPQFDFTTYSSQIFWFSICFIMLYFSISRIILPRIHAILKDRQSTINNDLSLANSLENQIAEIHLKIQDLRKKSTGEYQLRIELAAKESAKKREELLEELKEKIEKITEKSKADLKKFIAETKPKSEIAISNLVQTIEKKIFN